MSVLTDIDGERSYCACLTFYEPYDERRDDYDESGVQMSADDDMIHHSVMFAPKSIVLVSQLDYFETFKVPYVFCVYYHSKIYLRKITLFVAV